MSVHVGEGNGVVEMEDSSEEAPKVVVVGSVLVCVIERVADVVCVVPIVLINVGGDKVVEPVAVVGAVDKVVVKLVEMEQIPYDA
jgi:hypothetical protein